MAVDETSESIKADKREGRLLRQQVQPEGLSFSSNFITGGGERFSSPLWTTVSGSTLSFITTRDNPILLYASIEIGVEANGDSPPWRGLTFVGISIADVIPEFQNYVRVNGGYDASSNPYGDVADLAIATKTISSFVILSAPTTWTISLKVSHIKVTGAWNRAYMSSFKLSYFNLGS